MARVSGNVLGNLRGKLGNLSARTVDGETILAARPSSFSVSMTPESIAARARFAVTAKFAHCIMGIPDLVSIWEKVKLAGMSTFNTVFKKNYSFSEVDKPTTNNIITPDGFLLQVTSSNASASALSFELPALNELLTVSSAEVDLLIFALIVYFNPANPNDAYFKTYSHSKLVSAFDFAAPYSDSFSYGIRQQSVAAAYQDLTIYLAVATKDAEGKIVQCSATYANQL